GAECFLGIVPGWGGTQLMPRLVGATTAIECIVENPLRQNRMLDGRRAYQLDFADRLLEPAEFVDDSLAFATELARNSAETAPNPDTGDRHQDEPVADTARKARAR